MPARANGCVDNMPKVGQEPRHHDRLRPGVKTTRGIMKAIGIAAALLLIGQQSDALAQSQENVSSSANWVMPGCREFVNSTANEPLRQGVCIGLVRAMFFYGSTHFGVCPPTGSNVGQAVRVVVLYVDQRPARMHEVFEKFGLEALKQAWPCKR